MGKILDPMVLSDAIEQVIDRLRSGEKLSDVLIASSAEEFEIRPEALSLHFYRKFPDGEVGPAPPTQEEIQAASVANALRPLREQYEKFGSFNGKIALIGKRKHTITMNNKSRRFVMALDHVSLLEKRYSYSKLINMGFEILQQ